MGSAAVFANATEPRQVAAGETIFAAGETIFAASDTGRETFGLISGSVVLRRGDRTVRTLEPGDTVGEMETPTFAIDARQ